MTAAGEPAQRYAMTFFREWARTHFVQRPTSSIRGDLIIWGSLSLSDALLRAGEVDLLRLRVLPLLLGGGRPCSPPDLGLRRLSLATAQSFAGGLVVLEYSAALQPTEVVRIQGL